MLAALLASPFGAATAQTTIRTSVSSSGEEGDQHSFRAEISADGRFVAFESYATNLVPDDSNSAADIFVRDLQTGTTSRVSVASDATQANSGNGIAGISSDGRFVVYMSTASNLVSGDTNGSWDVFVHDRQDGTTERVSLTSGGSQANGDSFSGSLSPDGRFVLFSSDASNLVSGDTNGFRDVFVRDRQNGTTERISVATGGTQSDSSSYIHLTQAISADGRWVAFSSSATNLVAADTNGFDDVFVHDRATAETRRVSVSSTGTQGPRESGAATISADGRWVAFESFAGNLVAGDTNLRYDIFVHDLQTGVTERVSLDSLGGQGNESSVLPTISADGRFVAFQSGATNLVDGDANSTTDVFIRDRQTGITSRASVAANGSEGASPSSIATITGDGSAVAFESDSADLVAGDTNGWADVFVRFLGAGDPDDDGVPDAVENAAPNGGDGNDDGILDSEQANVTSLPNTIDDQFVTVVSPPDTTLADVVSIDPATLPPPPAGLESLPIGVVSFKVLDVVPGGQVTVEILLPAGTAISSYYKYGPEPGMPADHWYEFLDDGTTGAVIEIDRVTLTFVDGERGDDDLMADGIIVEPGGPVLSVGAYEFNGFFEPVDNPPIVNQMKAGSVVPVRFTLGRSFGLAILEDGYPRSQAIGCNTGLPIESIEESSTVGMNELKHGVGEGKYVYTWKTQKVWSGSCRRFELKLNDGTAAHVGDFKFVK